MEVQPRYINMDKIAHKNVAWIDLTSPGENEIALLQKEYGISHLPLHEITVETPLPKIERFENEIYAVLYFPIFNPQKRATEGKEVDFIITKDVLVTVHYEPIPPLTGVRNTYLDSPEAKDSGFSNTTAHLLFKILSQMYAYSLRELSHVKKNLDSLNEDLFDRNGREFARRILEVRRDILNFRRTLAPQRHFLELLELKSSDLLGRKSKQSFEDLLEAYDSVWGLLASYQEAIEAIHETNNTLLASKQNDTIQTLTMLSVISFYLTMIAAVFGMNALYEPIIGTPYDFWKIIGIMTVVTIGLIMFFRKKGWLN